MMKNKRRDFIKQAGMYVGSLALTSLFPSITLEENRKKFDFDISLAQWSLHKALFGGAITTLDFPKIAKTTYNISAVEYVNQFFKDKANDALFLKQLKTQCDDHGVKSVLIMVDQEGSLAAVDDKERKEAVENHYKWVEAAKFLGCHAIRVNLHGEGTEDQWKAASIDGLGQLVEFGANQDISIIVENHGQWSSKGNILAEVIKTVNSKYCGTLPDFGNFCVRRRDGD
ncbi:MAG TPA: TIM barrel protein, partial [Cytophagales bacterium]|nr:TIM barrel protein [Cytophagales bacterium]